VQQVVEGEQPPAPIFEPFVEHLVAADLELPHVFGHALEVLLLVDVHPSADALLLVRRRVLRVAAFRCDFVVARRGVTGDALPDLGRFEQVQRDQFPPQGDELPEERRVRGERHTREVNLEEFGVARAVGGTVEDGVDVGEEVCGGEAIRAEKSP